VALNEVARNAPTPNEAALNAEEMISEDSSRLNLNAKNANPNAVAPNAVGMFLAARIEAGRNGKVVPLPSAPARGEESLVQRLLGQEPQAQPPPVT
jgi:hypothetical protein